MSILRRTKMIVDRGYIRDIGELKAELEEEKDHSAFLEKLLKALHGKGWSKLTISEARRIREQRTD